jgi:RHS repeat-associated protein
VTDAGTAGPRLHYLHADHLGTPVAMTSAGLAQLEWFATFRPFGQAYAIAGSETLALRLPGQLLDPETGLHQNWYRDYDSRLGRYLQSDPIGLEGGLNTYAYVGGNSVSLIDPEGLAAPAIPAILGCLTNSSCALPVIATAGAFCKAVGDLADRFLNESSDGAGTADRPKPYAGVTPDDRPGDYKPARELDLRRRRTSRMDRSGIGTETGTVVVSGSGGRARETDAPTATASPSAKMVVFDD